MISRNWVGMVFVLIVFWSKLVVFRWKEIIFVNVRVLYYFIGGTK